MNHAHTNAHTAPAFYAKIASKYDWIFSPWDEFTKSQADALAPLLDQHGVHTVLDCACGTGLQAIGLALHGYQVVGSDLCQPMLDRAAAHSAQANVSFPLIQCDFASLTAKVHQDFDAVLCMGNSLPHLATDVDLLNALQNMRACLKPGGLLVVEMRDYDHIVADKTRYIPLRVNVQHGDQTATIFFVLDHFPDKIRFDLVYLIQEKDGTTTVETDAFYYYPILSARLERLLSTAGFEQIAIHANGEFTRCTAIRKR